MNSCPQTGSLWLPEPGGSPSGKPNRSSYAGNRARKPWGSAYAYGGAVGRTRSQWPGRGRCDGGFGRGGDAPEGPLSRCVRAPSTVRRQGPCLDVLPHGFERWTPDGDGGSGSGLGHGEAPRQRGGSPVRIRRRRAPRSRGVNFPSGSNRPTHTNSVCPQWGHSGSSVTGGGGGGVRSR